MTAAQQVQHAINDTPAWVSWLIMAAGWAVSLLQPVAILVTIVWGGLQIYLAVEKRWKGRK